MKQRLLLMRGAMQPSAELMKAVYEAVRSVYPDAVWEEAPKWDALNDFHVYDRPVPGRLVIGYWQLKVAAETEED